MKSDMPADSYTLKNVTLSGNATEIKNAGLEITLPQGWNVPEPAVFRDENGIISAMINRGENSFAEISIEKTGKENLYATFADFRNDYIDSERIELKADSSAVGGMSVRKMSVYQNIDEAKKPTTTGFGVEGYYGDRNITYEFFFVDSPPKLIGWKKMQ
jgi:hypothetical protein